MAIALDNSRLHARARRDADAIRLAEEFRASIIESLDTVEHPFEPGLSEEELESEELPPDEPPSEELERPAEESPTGEPTASEEGEAESGEEDVLADTPDFLRDAPEDDELWFEQGEPKDFDFD